MNLWRSALASPTLQSRTEKTSRLMQNTFGFFGECGGAEATTKELTEDPNGRVPMRPRAVHHRAHYPVVGLRERFSAAGTPGSTTWLDGCIFRLILGIYPRSIFCDRQSSQISHSRRVMPRLTGNGQMRYPEGAALQDPHRWLP